MANLLGEYWKRASNDLGIRIESPFKLSLKTGSVLVVDVLVKDFGARLGMLITTDYNKIEPFESELIEMGYGYSVLSEPSENRLYNVESYKVLLNDWGWSRDPQSAPSWVKNSS